MTDPRLEAAARAINTEGWTCYGGVHEPGKYGKCAACTLICNEAARAALAAADKASTITTVEELDALPEHSIYLNEDGDAYRANGAGYDDSELDTGELRGPTDVALPARVIHFGGS